MFPFLAPILQPDHCERQGTIRYVEMTFLSDSPLVSRANSAASQTKPVNVRKISGGSNKSSNEGLNVSRPSSRQKTKSPLASSQPTSARSAKSSPIPPYPSEKPPHASRHKNKGLEVSSAMKELFGGSPEGTPTPPRESQKKDLFSKELENEVHWHNRGLKDLDINDKSYERINRKKSENSQIFKPGPEYYEGADEELPDPNCPAEQFLLSQEALEECQDLNEPSTSQRNVMHESVPGPDLGITEEELAPDGHQSEMVATDAAEEKSPISKADRGSPTAEGGDDASPAAGRGEARDAEEADGGGSSSRTDQQDGKKNSGDGDGAMSLLIKGAQVVNDDSIFTSDVLIQDGVITDVAAKIEAPAGVQVIDASGKMLLPAGIDVHTNFNAVDSVDDLQTGCKAALSGGTATVVDVVRPNEGESPLAAFSRVKQSLAKSLCNVALSVVIRNWSDAVKKDMEKLVSEGVNSFILEVDSDDKLYKLLEHSRSLGTHVRVLPENRTLVPLLEKKMLELGITGPEGFLQSRPEEMECEKVSNICLLSQLANCPVSILAVSSAETLRRVERSQGNGALAHPEINVAAIASDGSHYFDKCIKKASAHLTEVPLRPEGKKAIISALSSQPLAICTSAHKAVSSEKRTHAEDFTKMPKGTTGAEERMFVVWEKAVRTGKIDPMRFVAVTSSNASKVFNMYPKKGRIAVGADADLVVWDASSKKKLGASEGQSKADVSVFDDLTVHATVCATIVGGNVAWRDGSLQEAKGGFLALSPNSPFIFSVVAQREKFGWAEKVERDNAPSSKPIANGHKKSGDFDRDRNRKNTMDSSIDFGTDRASNSRGRNPPGGRTTGFW